MNDSIPTLFDCFLSFRHRRNKKSNDKKKKKKEKKIARNKKEIKEKKTYQHGGIIETTFEPAVDPCGNTAIHASNENRRRSLSESSILFQRIKKGNRLRVKVVSYFYFVFPIQSIIEFSLSVPTSHLKIRNIKRAVVNFSFFFFQLNRSYEQNGTI